MRTTPLRSSLQTIIGTFSVLSFLISLCVFFVPFLSIDRQFNVSPELRIENVIRSFDPVMIDAIWNSILLSAIASLFAIIAGASVTRLLRSSPFIVGSIIILIYTVNPITRALAFGDLLTLYTPVLLWIQQLCGEWAGQMIILPALILGAHYLPLYLLRFLFVIRKPTVSHSLTGLFDALFVTIPAFLRGLPISFSMFFLLTFFDYWVIQVMSGGKALYWSQMFEQKAFIAREVGQAGTLIILGLFLTALAYFGMLALTRLLLFCLRFIRPLSLRRLTHLSVPSIVRRLLDGFILLFLTIPLFYSILRLFSIDFSRGIPLMNGAFESIWLTLLLSLSITLLSTILAFLLSTFFTEQRRKHRWWLPSLYFLALVPEAAYVLFSLCVTGFGILKASPLWLSFLMISFTAPMSFFLFESLWRESEERKLWILAPSLSLHFFSSMTLALSEWKRFFLLTFAINIWMTTDNVFITNFAAGPKWKPLAATIFTATKRGFSDAEFFTGFIGSCSVLFLILLLIYLLPKEDNIEQNS